MDALTIADFLVNLGLRIWEKAQGRQLTQEEINARIARARAINSIPLSEYELGEVPLPPIPTPPSDTTTGSPS